MEQHLESQDLQYQLAQRAQALGWAAEQVVIIDEDLGKSAITACDRSGFQRLVAAVGLAQVGIILVTQVSRLARNCGDWYQLLDLASVWRTLIGDADAIYDPRNYNDRLLLGLKGAFSEAQWYTMRSQLYRAQLNKARRGELALHLPVGYDRLPDGEVVFNPNLEVQSAIRLVFEQFDRLGSAWAVLRYCRHHQLELPRRIQSGPDRGEIAWVKPSYQAIYRIVKLPAYAGAYTYGKRRNVRLPGIEQKVIPRLFPIEEWAVLRRDAFPGYISWEHYLKNQTRLRENAQGVDWSKGAPRSGAALLQGIVICGRCGRPIHPRYSNKPAYVCEMASKQYGDPRCQNFMVPHIDEAVSQVFLEAVQPAHLEAALAALEQVEAERQRLATRWQQRLERGRYEADLARRRYERVDPDNRMVAAELERQWEDKLRTWQRLEREWEQARELDLRPLSEADKALIRQLAEDVPALWHAKTTTPEERKRLLRCLIQDVTLDAFTKPGYSLIRIRWQTGSTTVVEAERPRPGCRTAPALVERIRQLAQHHPDDQIATILNDDGVPTATGKHWNKQRVETIRKQYQIATACPYFTNNRGPRGDGLIAAPEAAQRLGVTHSVISAWFRRGLLVGHQRQPGGAVWVRLTDEDLQRLDGSTPLRPDLVPMSEVARMLDIAAKQVSAEIRAKRLIPYRLFIKNRWRWYVQLPAEQSTLTTKP